MGFRVTTLMENTASRDSLAAEHGLSLLIEGEDLRILYDTGASPRFLLNAKALGIGLDHLDAVVLSHGHFDHTGGVAAFLAHGYRPKAIYLGRNFFDERFCRKKDGLLEISALIGQKELMATGIPCLIVEAEPQNVAPGVWLLSGFSPETPLEKPLPSMLRRKGELLKMDHFEDEAVVVLETENELVLISGCSHSGIVSMCARVSRLFKRSVTTFIGGTHLMAANEDRIEKTCELLQEQGIQRLGACHCNGEKANAYFEANFSGFFRNNVSSVVVIE